MTDLHERAEALLATADTMTKGDWFVVGDEGDSILVSTDRNDRAHSNEDAAVIHSSEWTYMSAEDLVGVVILRNDTPALVRDLMAELEIRIEQVRAAGAEIARLRAQIATEHRKMMEQHEVRDAGPAPFAGRDLGARDLT